MRRGKSGQTVADIDFRRCWAAAFGLFVVISTIWSLASPLGASPDENAHIIRAAATARGQIVEPDAPGRAPLNVIVTVPRDYAASLTAPFCFAFDQRIPAGCERPFPASTAPTRTAIYVGRYPPLYYALVGWPTLLFRNPAGFYLVRLVSALFCDALLALAVATAATVLTSAAALAGVIVAATPMVIYLSGMINPSSLEVPPAVAFWTGLATLGSRFRADPPRRLVALTTVAGTTLTLARSISPVWTLTALIVVSPLFRDRDALRRLGRRSDIRISAAVLVASAATTTAWTLAEHGLRTLPGQRAPRAPLPTVLHGAIGNATGYIPQAVGMFGLAVPVPEIVVLAWVAMAGALGILAWSRSETRAERSCIGLAFLAAGCLPTVIVTAGARSHGYIGFGRYFLPLYIGLPVVAAALLGRRPAEADCRLARLFVALAAAGQLVSVYWCLHRYLVGSDGPVSPLARVPLGWSPPVPGLLLDVAFAIAMSVAWLLGVRLAESTSGPGGWRPVLPGMVRRGTILRVGGGDRERADLDGVEVS